MHHNIFASSISLPPQVTKIDFNVPPQGGVVAGSFSIAGGMGNDLGMALNSANGGAVWNGGVIRGFGNVSVRLRGRRYQLVLNNKIGPFWVSPKTLSGKIELIFYR